MPFDPAPFRDSALTAARYLAGQGYSASEIRQSLLRRQGITGWRTADITVAANNEAARAKAMRRALAADQDGALDRQLAGINSGIQQAYRYGLMYTFGDGESRTIVVNSMSRIDMSTLINKGKSAWSERSHGSPTGKLDEYDPSEAESVQIITFERRS